MLIVQATPSIPGIALEAKDELISAFYPIYKPRIHNRFSRDCLKGISIYLDSILKLEIEECLRDMLARLLAS